MLCADCCALSPEDGLTCCHRPTWLSPGVSEVPGTHAVSSPRVFLSRSATSAQPELGAVGPGRGPAGVATPRSQRAGRGRGELCPGFGVWPGSSQLPATAPRLPGTRAQWTETSQLLPSGQINSRAAVYSCRDGRARSGGAAHRGDERRPSSAPALVLPAAARGGGGGGGGGGGRVGAVLWDPEAVTSEPGLAFSSRKERPGPGVPGRGSCWEPEARSGSV